MTRTTGSEKKALSMNYDQTHDRTNPIEEDDQMEYGFLDEAMDGDDLEDSEMEEDDESKVIVDDDPDNLDADDD
tara:strand:+ start:268 stop:489 length:222 start_codon:yes stop_codon:yes gene_type:complete